VVERERRRRGIDTEQLLAELDARTPASEAR
jgi:hypothetical protein